jgi:uncharacterized protein YndB with AHSA1/START domain
LTLAITARNRVGSTARVTQSRALAPRSTVRPTEGRTTQQPGATSATAARGVPTRVTFKFGEAQHLCAALGHGDAQSAAIARSADDDTVAGTIEVDIFIPSPREAVFRFFVEPALVAEWLGEVHALDGRLGGVFRIETAFEGHVTGRFLTLSPPDRVVWTWERDDAALAPARVGIELVVHHEGTLVQLVHRDPPVDDSRRHSPVGVSRGGRSPSPRGDDPRSFWMQALAKLYAAVLRSGA